MPHESLRKLEKLVAEDKEGQFMVPADKKDLAALATIEALRAQTDVLKGMAQAQDEFRQGMNDIQKTVHSMDKRLDPIENKTLERDIERNHQRLNAHSERMDRFEIGLTEITAELKGASSFAKAVKDYGPILVAMVAAIVFLATQGRL